MKLHQDSRTPVASILLLSVPLVFTAARALGQGNGYSVPPPQVNNSNYGVEQSQINTATNTSDATKVAETTGSAEGNLISLEYRNAPLIEVIRTLAEGANINVTLSSEVERGSPVTIRLNKVTYEQAIKAILDTYKFGSIYENGILKIDTLANLNAQREALLKEKEASWKLLPTKRLVWQVNYAKAVELQPILDTMLKGYKIDPRFSIVADKRTNKLIIEGINDALVETKAILENLDKRKQQVLIEARIVEASNELSKTLSVTWGTRFGFDGNRGLANGLIFPNSLTGNIGGAGALGGSAPAPGLANSPTQLGTLQFTVGSINNLVNIDAVLRAYETESLANVIASPRVVVQDQEKAVINEDVSLSRSVLGPDGKPEGRNTVASLSLQVSPQVTSENTLELDINVTRQTPTNPPTDPVQGSIKRTANTKLIVANGETAVIGGLYQTQKFKGQGRVPILGRLPIIGALFRTNEEQTFRSELMVLITPRILPGGQGRPAAKADLPLLNGSTNTGGENGFGNSNGGNDFSNNANSNNGNSAGNTAAPFNNGAAAGKTNVVTPPPAGGANNLGDANDFGTNVGGGGNGADLGNAGGNTTNAANNLGGTNNLNNLNGGGNNTGGNSGGDGAGNDAGDLNNLGNNGGGNAPANDNGASGGNNLNNLNGGDF
ncbi:MAG: hypothetical protein RLZZ488_905 [Pseudomonadota bacterium]|jgi:type IV pilus secretin PilQ/predicted competence protein